jgi:hypothetical protein
VAADPLADITALHRPVAVFRRGVPVPMRPTRSSGP